MNNSTAVNYMSDGEILHFIKNYIDNTIYNHAILIDGSWGSGKTYFIKHTLIPVLKKEYRDKDELTNQILIEALPFKHLRKNKSFNIASNIGKVILGSALSLNGFSLPKHFIKIKDFISLDNYILIFDDLERCNININAVLGYINNFVEHDGLKTIIIANESEIATTQLATYKELKVIAAMNPNISFPKEKDETEDGDFFKNTENTDEKIDTDELYQRIKKLFGEDALYKQIKEKLIGYTIYYKPNINNIVDNILANSIFNSEAKKIITKNKDLIIHHLEHHNHTNIRTLI